MSNGKERGSKFVGLKNDVINAKFPEQVASGEMFVVAISDAYTFGKKKEKTGVDVLFAQSIPQSWPGMFGNALQMTAAARMFTASDQSNDELVVTHIQTVEKSVFKTMKLKEGVRVPEYNISMTRCVGPLSNNSWERPWMNRDGALCVVNGQLTHDYTTVTSDRKITDAQGQPLTSWDGVKMTQEEALEKGLAFEANGTIVSRKIAELHFGLESSDAIESGATARQLLHS